MVIVESFGVPAFSTRVGFEFIVGDDQQPDDDDDTERQKNCDHGLVSFVCVRDSRVAGDNYCDRVDDGVEKHNALPILFG